MKIKSNTLKTIKDTFVQLLYPTGIKCIFCNAELPRDEKYSICFDCDKESQKIEESCLRCGRQKLGDANYCDTCTDVNRSFDMARSAYVYEGGVTRAIHNFKYNSEKHLADNFSQIMSDIIKKEELDFDIVTFVPLHKKRQRERGYNQSELLAKKIARIFEVPCESLLTKTKHTQKLAKLSFHERKELLKGSFELAREMHEIKGRRVLLVDDVLTTATTVEECSKILRKAKADAITVLTIASTKSEPTLY
ncbi:MAG: ComF family protein [Firmicutes bacterium]|nr:ComF family protein [Bacillota bacterium]MCL2256002.1 ComF family protein [Bacillota bacterium]